MDADTGTRRARAAWAFSGLSQERLANEAGLKKDRVRAILTLTNTSEIHLEELHAIATAAGVPRPFMETGFDQPGVEIDSDVERRLAELERQIRELQTDRNALGELQETLGVVTGQIQTLAGSRQPTTGPPAPESVEDAVDELRRATRVMEQLLGRLGRDVGKRDLQSRRAADRPRRAG